MKITSVIFTILIFNLFFLSCNDCRNNDCEIFSTNICFDLIDETDNSLIFDNEIYAVDSIITQSNLINNTIFINAFQPSQNNNCIVIMTDTTKRYFVALNHSDIDTIDVDYQINFKDCCKNTTVETVGDFNLTYNSNPICTNCSDIPIIYIRK